jgi:hypothetical protein
MKITLFWHVTPCRSKIYLPHYRAPHLKRTLIIITTFYSREAFVKAAMKIKFHKSGAFVLSAGAIKSTGLSKNTDCREDSC